MGPNWGNSSVGGGERIQVEFVSANPTGPLHVGHGRGAAVGDVLANLLAAAGWKVEREYYINDAGRQMSLLGKSVLARYRQALGKECELPEDGYKGDYIREVARDLILKKGESLIGLDEGEAAAYATIFAGDWILSGIRKDLEDFGVTFDAWVSEKRLLETHPLGELMDDLRGKGEAFEAEDALWLRTTAYGDDKDRVLVRSNGQATYFANDILYHRDKFNRGFDRIIDIWGADHHGYINRMKAAVQTLGKPADSLSVILIQLVRLLRGGEPVAMSTRSGEFDTLRQVMDEVGRDAARFFFLTRKADAQLDFDLEVAKHRSSDNPVYYVQYAHARIKSIFRKLPEGIERAVAAPDLTRLVHPEEMALIKKVALYPDVVAQAALMLEPHRIPFFLQDISSRFHLYYNRHRVISPDEALSGARLFLLDMVGRVIGHGLGIVGVSAPESM
jgi:arginyl-tRNA synthetase